VSFICLFCPGCLLNAWQHVGITSTTQAALDQETEVKLQDIDDIYLQKKDIVISAIGKRAIVVQPELHRNLRKRDA